MQAEILQESRLQYLEVLRHREQEIYTDPS